MIDADSAEIISMCPRISYIPARCLPFVFQLELYFKICV